MEDKQSNPCDRDWNNFRQYLRIVLRNLQCLGVKNSSVRFKENFQRLFTLSDTGVHIDDVAIVTQLLLLLFEFDDSEEHQQYFLESLKIFARPFKLLKSSDLFTVSEDMQNLFSSFGHLLGSTNNIDITRAILNCVSKMVLVANDESFLYKGVVLDNLARSELPSILYELLVVTDLDIYIEVLVAVRSLLVTNAICQTFIKVKTIEVVMYRLWYGNETTHACYDEEILINMSLPIHFDLSHRVLWTLALAYDNSPPSFQQKITREHLVSDEAWRSARNIFLIVTASNKWRSIRNIFFLLLRTLAKIYPSPYCRVMFREVCRLTFCTEIPQTSWISQVRFQPDETDYAFKVALMTTLGANKTHPLTPECLNDMNAIPALLKLLSPEAKLIWTQGQRRKLMKYGLIVLDNIVPLVLEEFVANDGPAKLVYLIRCVLSEMYSISLLVPILRCLRTTLATKHKIGDVDVCDKYESAGLVPLLLIYLKDTVNLPGLVKRDQDCVLTLYCVLSELTKHQHSNIMEVTAISLQLLGRYLKPSPNDVFLRPQIIIAILDFLWENTLRFEDVLQKFISDGGMYLLMDIIEAFPLAIKMVGLGMLVDLCTMRQDGLAFVVSWRGKNGDTVMPFLMKIYRAEMKLDKYRSNKIDISTDVEIAMLSQNKHSFKYRQQLVNGTSITTLDTLASCKPKIHAMVILLRCHDREESVSTYGLSTPLSLSDKITVLLAEYYLPLRLGEAWIEVQSSLERFGIKPCPFDQTVLDFNVTRYDRYVAFIKAEEDHYLAENRVKEKRAELNLYNRLKEGTIAESLDALDLMKYEAQCTQMFCFPSQAKVKKTTVQGKKIKNTYVYGKKAKK